MPTVARLTINKNDRVVVDVAKLMATKQKIAKRIGVDEIDDLDVVKAAGSYANSATRIYSEEQNVRFATLQKHIEGLQIIGACNPPLNAADFVLNVVRGKRTSAKAADVSSSIENPKSAQRLVNVGPGSAVSVISAVVVIVLLVGWQSGIWQDVDRASAAQRTRTAESDLHVGDGPRASDSQGLTMEKLSAAVSHIEPSVFYGSDDNRYEVARVLPDRAALGGETNFIKDLQDATYTFDMLANTGGVVREEWAPIIEEGLRRGVDYRLILCDYRDSNPHFGSFSAAVGEMDRSLGRGAANEHHRQLLELTNKLADDARRGSERVYRGSLTVKWNQKPLLYTMWLRDAGEEDAIGHLGVHFYQGKNFWPCTRCSRKTAPRMVENMAAEFEAAWKASIPFNDLPYLPLSNEEERSASRETAEASTATD